MRLIIILWLLFYSFKTNAQSYVPIECWEVTQLQINTAPTPFEFTNVGCIDIPNIVGTTVYPGVVSGTKNITLSADNVVHMQPGFSVNGLSGGGGFHAYIKQGDFIPVIYVPTSSPGDVGKWEKIEIGVPIPSTVETQIANFISTGVGINPFNENDISIEANFDFLPFPHIADPAHSRLIYGFYYRDFIRLPLAEPPTWQEVPTDHNFRVRFAPSAIGNWKCTISIKIGGVVTQVANPFYFKCIESSSKGPIVNGSPFATDKRHRYLKYLETDEMFFANGLNLDWSSLDYLRVNDYVSIEQWLQKIDNNSGNYIDLGCLPWTYGVEWEKLNNYYARMSNAWELDRIFDQVEQKDIYINLLTLIHNEFQTFDPDWPGGEPHRLWGNNCYNTINNGGLTSAVNANDFLTDSNSKKFFKQRLRYLLSRYGYSVNFIIVELMSEIDKAIANEDSSPGTRDDIKDWFIEMRNYIRTTLGYNYKFVSGSYTQDHQTEKENQRIFSVADITLLHYYSANKDANFGTFIKGRFAAAAQMLNSGSPKNKPTIFDESGEHWVAGDYCSDILFHTNLWATSFMGCYGTGQHWNWQWLLYQNYETNLKGLSKFLEGENFALEQYKQEKWTDNALAFNKNTKYEAFYLRDDNTFGSDKAIGWVHNTSFWWGNLGPINSCIQSKIDSLPLDDTGLPFSLDDSYDYAGKLTDPPNKGDDEITYYIGWKLDVQGLKPLFKYKIEWFNTITGNSIGITEEDHAGPTGKAKFKIPGSGTDITPNYGDLGFKVIRSGHSLEVVDSTNQSSVSGKVVTSDLEIKVYPNPASKTITVESQSGIQKIEIYSVSGSLIYKTDINATSKTIDVNLETGYYLLVAYMSDVTIKKVIKLSIINK